MCGKEGSSVQGRGKVVRGKERSRAWGTGVVVAQGRVKVVCGEGGSSFCYLESRRDVLSSAVQRSHFHYSR